MEKITTPESVLKIFHRIATVEGGYVPTAEPEPEEKDDKKKGGRNNASKRNNNRKPNNNNINSNNKNDNKTEEKTGTEENKMSPNNTPGNNARKVTFDNFMAATHFLYGDSFTHFDAYRGFTSAIQQQRLTSTFDEATNEFIVNEGEMTLEELASSPLDKNLFIHALKICGLAIVEYNEKLEDEKGGKTNELPPPKKDFNSNLQRQNEEAQKAMDAANVFANKLLDVLPDNCDSNHFNKSPNFAQALYNALVENISFGAKLSIDIFGIGLLKNYEHSLRQGYFSFRDGDPLRWPAELEEGLVDVGDFTEFIDTMCAISVDIGQSSDLTIALQGMIELMGIHEDLPDNGGASWIRVDPNKDLNVSNINPNASIVSPMDDNNNGDDGGGLYMNDMNVRDPELAQTLHNEAKLSSIRLNKLLRDLEMDEELPGSKRGFVGTKGVNIKLDETANPHQWHPMPCIIREVLRAPSAPLPVENLMEAALSYHNVSHYDAAAKTYAAAREVWMEEENYNRQDYIDMMREEDAEYNPDTDAKLDKPLIPPRSEIFLLCSMGSVHESNGNDEMALSLYMEARRTAMTHLDHNDPDVAIPYSHVGSICYHLGRYALSFRCYNVALNIRESALGKRHPDTASLYCNIGCCLCMMGPKLLIKARYYLRLSEKILKDTLGPYHIRTSTSSRNVSRVRSRTGIITQPSAGYKKVNPKYDMYTHSKPPPGIEFLREDTRFWKAGIGGQLPAIKAVRGGGKKKKKKKKK